MALLLNSCKSSDIILADAYIDGPLTIVVCEEEPFIPLAEDLAMHLRLLTDSKIPVNPETKPAGSYIIRITQLAEGVKEDDLLPEEARWHFGKDEAVFYGQGPLGPSHAVYLFLEEVLGFRWPTPNVIYIPPRQKIIPVFQTDGSWIPSLAAREIRPAKGQVTDPAMRLWYKRMRTGEHDAPPFANAFTNWWEKYGKEHPDYFALVNDKREPVLPVSEDKSTLSPEAVKHAQEIISICPSNPAVAKQIIDNWDKTSLYINICENEAPSIHACHCEKCREMDPHPMQELDDFIGADRYVHLANEVLKLAKPFRPDVKVTMNSTNATQEPSQNIKLDTSIIIGLAPTDFTITYIEHYLNAWHKAGMREFKYCPKSHRYFAPTGYPIGNTRHFFNIFQTMYHNGALYFDYDASDESTDIFRFYSDYILMHAMNNPDVPFERWERDFAQALVGDAAMDLLKYFHQWEHLWDSRVVIDLPKLATIENDHCFARHFAKDVDKYYPDTDFAQAGQHLLNALKHTTLTPEQKQRINEVKLFNDHATLLCKAVATKNPWDVRTLRDFRRDNNLPAIMPYELALGDYSGVITMKDLNFEQPLTHLPLFWNFKLDPDGEGEIKNLQNNRDFSFWDGLMPTDGSWQAPNQAHDYPSPELREKCSTYQGTAWYACEVDIPRNWKDRRRVFIHIPALQGDAKIWTNGIVVGSHPHVHKNDSIEPFDVEITEEIDWSKKKQLITIKITAEDCKGGILEQCFIGSIYKKQ